MPLNLKLGLSPGGTYNATPSTCNLAASLTSGVAKAVASVTAYWLKYTVPANGLVYILPSLSGSPTYAVYKNGSCSSLPAASTTAIGGYWLSVSAGDVIRISITGISTGTLTLTDYAIGSPDGVYIRSPQFCFTDAGATTPCGVGDSVYTWVDATANARTLTQATSSLRPTYQADGVFFDATDDRMLSASGAFPTPTAMQHAVFVKIKMAGSPVNNGGIATLKGATTAGGWTMLEKAGSASPNWGTYDSAGSANRPANTALASGSTYTLGMNGGTYRLNGANDGTYPGSFSDQPLVGQLQVGRENVGRVCNGYVSGILVYSAPVDSTVQSAAESLLGAL
jgi:hypothetical protein